MSQPTAAQAVQRLLAQEQQALAELGSAEERARAAREALGRLRAALEGVRLGQEFEKQSASQAPSVSPEVAPEG